MSAIDLLRHAESAGMAVTISCAADDLRALIRDVVRDSRAEYEAEMAAREEPATVTRREAARLLGVSEATLGRMSNDGRLRAVRIGARMMYKESDLQRIMRGSARYQTPRP